MDTVEAVELGYRALANKDEIEGVAAALQPYIDMVRADAPTLIPRIERLIKTLFPDDGAPAPIYDVRWIQNALNKLGDNLVVDGHYGPLTHAAVSQFQATHGLTVDGWVGPKTFAVLTTLARDNV